MQMIKHEDAPVEAGQPFVVATLPLPPSVNASYKIVDVPKKEAVRVPSKSVNGHYIYNVYSGRIDRTVKRLGATKELQDFKRDAAKCLRSLDCATINDITVTSIREMSKLNKPVHIPLKFVVRFYYKSRWQRDIDGGVKAVQDALFNHLQLNDNLVVDLQVEKLVDAKQPRVEVELSIAE